MEAADRGHPSAGGMPVKSGRMNTNGQRGGTSAIGAAVSCKRLGLRRFAAQHGLSAGQLHYWAYSPCGLKADIRVPGFHEITAVAPCKQEGCFGLVTMMDEEKVTLPAGANPGR